MKREKGKRETTTNKKLTKTANIEKKEIIINVSFCLII